MNNAGILRDRFFFKMSVEEWKAVIDVHLNGSFYVSRAAVNYFRDQGSGAYVHMTSTSGLIGNFGQANYAAAKLGIVGLSKSIALDLAKYHVRSNCISPFAWSRMIGTIPADSDEQKARLEKLKVMETSKIAPMAVYLLSDGAPTVGVVNHVDLLEEVMRLNRHRKVKINAISFDPKPEERELLQTLADRNFGVYVER